MVGHGHDDSWVYHINSAGVAVIHALIENTMPDLFLESCHSNGTHICDTLSSGVRSQVCILASPTITHVPHKSPHRLHPTWLVTLQFRELTMSLLTSSNATQHHVATHNTHAHRAPVKTRGPARSNIERNQVCYPRKFVWLVSLALLLCGSSSCRTGFEFVDSACSGLQHKHGVVFDVSTVHVN